MLCARQQAFGATPLLQRCVLFRSIHPRGYAATFRPHSSTNHESYLAEFGGVCPDVLVVNFSVIDRKQPWYKIRVGSKAYCQ